MTDTNKTWYQRNWRWCVLGTLFLATFLNYFDRQTLGAAMSPISKEFGLDNAQVGNLLSAFLLTYAISHLFVGLILDKIKKIRLFFPVMVLGWSITTIVTGLVKNFEGLLWMRYLLGIWESVNFPICIMIIARIFPAGERSLASGIFASGAFLATLIAPKVVIYFSNEFTWRYSFIFAGSLGLIWLIPWLLIFNKPENRSEQWVSTTSDRRNVLDWEGISAVLKSPAFWGVALIGVGIIPSLYFSTQWLPFFIEKSLGEAYNQALGNKLLLIYLMQDGGLWIGGFIVLWMANKGLNILRSRKIVILAAFFLMIAVLLLNINAAIGFYVFVLCLFTFGIGMFLGNQHAFKQDVLKSHVATVAAWVGFIEMMFTHFVIKRIGFITNVSADFTPVFIFLGALALFALVVVFVLLKPKWVKIE